MSSSSPALTGSCAAANSRHRQIPRGGSPGTEAGLRTHFGLEEGEVAGDDDEGDGPEMEVARERHERVLERGRAEVLVAVVTKHL